MAVKRFQDGAMASLTLKNVPDKLLKELRKAAHGDRRSLSQESLHLLEEALGRRAGKAPSVKVQAQIDAWRKLAPGMWQSALSPSEEARELRRSLKSGGRKVDL
jgi:plasmid stability protein